MLRITRLESPDYLENSRLIYVAFLIQRRPGRVRSLTMCEAAQHRRRSRVTIEFDFAGAQQAYFGSHQGCAERLPTTLVSFKQASLPACRGKRAAGDRLTRLHLEWVKSG